MLTDEQSMDLLVYSGLPVDPDLYRDELLHEIFEATAARLPDKNAVETTSASMTYRELDEHSNRFAHYLRSQNIGVEDKVAFQLPRTEFVYVAMLGIMKAGAAYVPLDPSYPADRVGFILDDSGAKLFVTSEDLFESKKEEIGKLDVTVLIATPDTDFPDQSSASIPSSATGQKRENLAYVIYTSGTTGRPKGCLLEHRHICNEIRSAATVYGIVESDRVFQGASVAFDASLEEIWMAFLNGCSLVVGTKEIMQSGPHFADILAVLQVTVLSCVPTLLSMVDKDIPTLRIIIFGGEACPKDLAARWHRPGRYLFNSYGPTEATVIATCAHMEPNEPVTIGFPIPNYKAYIVDENLKLLPPGEIGELCLGGLSIARGYLNRDDLNQAKFVELETLTPGQTERVYRTGDLVRFDTIGDIEFLGRADDQVKLRGFRIELSEIESILLQTPGVLSASVALDQELQQLAAYLVMREGLAPNKKVIIKALKERLPAYMMPSWLDVVGTLPMLVSGKVNRKALPKPVNPLVDDERRIVEPRTSAEKTLHAIWAEVFSRKDISVADDFFLDLGGHSLLAARFVSRLRRLPGYENVAMTDVYQNTTIEALAEKFAAPPADGVRPEPGAGGERPSTFRKVDAKSHFRCGVWQACLLPVIFSIHAWNALGLFVMFDIFYEDDMGFIASTLLAIVIYAASMPAMLVLPLIGKWLLLGRIKPGRHPLWGGYYIRYWFVRQLVRAMPLVQSMLDTPAINVFMRAMGATIGKNVVFGGGDITTFDLLEIGDGASVGADSSLDGSWVEDGMLCLDTIKIGAGCVIGNRASVAPGCSMADHSTLGDLALLNEKRHVPSFEVWGGSPARPMAKRLPKDTPDTWTSRNILPLLAGSIALPLLAEVPVFPGLLLALVFKWYDTFQQFFYAVPLIAVSFILIVCAQAVLLKKYLLPKVEEGTYPINSTFYVRHWFFSKTYHSCLMIVGTVFSTLYLRYWFQLLGAKLGKRTEVSTACRVQPDLLDIGDGCFVADDVMLGAPKIAHGHFTVGKVHVGDRTFLGNSSVVPAGSVIGNGCLLGCLSTPPGNGQMTDGTNWFGNPAIFLPNRQKDEVFDENLTYQPPTGLLVQRYAIEACRIILPNLLFVGMAFGALGWIMSAWEFAPWLVVPLLPASYLVMAVIAFAVLAGLKWSLIGVYEPGSHPLWCNYIWRTELITGVFEAFGARFILDILRGTPFMAWPLRLLGVHIGRRPYIDSTWFTEMDLITIGDDVALNEAANLQTHLFEDRVMKEGAITIGDRTSIGSKAFVLYDTRVGDEVVFDDLSLLMKGESLPGHSRWHGIPSRRQT